MTTDLGYQVAAKEMAEALVARVINNICNNTGSKTADTPAARGILQPLLQALIDDTYVNYLRNDPNWRKRTESALREFFQDISTNVILGMKSRTSISTLLKRMCAVMYGSMLPINHPSFIPIHLSDDDCEINIKPSLKHLLLSIYYRIRKLTGLCGESELLVEDHQAPFVFTLYLICLNINFNSEQKEPKKEDNNGQCS